ncbi:hypothetical protein AMJ80_09050 [bacterium SM23_31]|nr:MAG: hypothetical protein AMJ80_09050 [bacterium SM23_31]
MNSKNQDEFPAPRFKSYLEHKAGRRIFVWAKAEWQAVKPYFGSPILLDINNTPIASVSEDAIVVAAAAQEVSSTGVGIAIYRFDPNDPKPYNVDRYGVWEDLPSRCDFKSIVNAASTSANQNLFNSLNQNVFLVQLDKGPSHWLSSEELPIEVKLVIKEQNDKDDG